MLLTKTIPIVALEVKVNKDETRGYFEGYASVFDNVDLGGDRVHQGAFTESIDKSAGSVPILWGHDPSKTIGISTSLKEDNHGLYAEGELNLETMQGREALALARQGAVKGLSIGYQVKDGHLAIEEDEYVFELTKLDLFEFSMTPIPMNPKAQITAVKSLSRLRLISQQCKELQELFQPK